MDLIHTLGLAFGTSFASGVNLYLTVAALGLLHRFDVVELPASWQVLAEPMVLGIAIALYGVEFFADKIPLFDSLWDVVHTFIRPPAAALLAYGALGEASEPWRIAATLIAGGVAFSSHGSKTSTRAAVNASPEPFSNWILSLAEDALALFVAWLAATHPILTFAVVGVLLVLSTLILVKLFQVFASLFSKGRARRPRESPLAPS